MSKSHKGRKKQTKFEIHNTQYQYLATDKKVAKIAKEKFGKITPEVVYKHTAKTADYLHDSIGHICGAEELYWLNNSRKVVFLTEDLISMLFRATFSLEEFGTISQPKGLKSFCAAIPKRTTIKSDSGREIAILPFLFSMMPLRDWINEVKSEYLSTTGSYFETDPELLADKDEMILTLTYKNKNQVLYQTVEKISNLPEILTTTGITDKKSIEQHQVLDDNEREQSKMMLRLAASFLIYTTVKQGMNLTDGYPKNSVFDIATGFNRAFWNPVTADYKPTWINKKKESEVIGAHFKNLSDESDYQGEYAWMPVGSRWEFVDEH